MNVPLAVSLVRTTTQAATDSTTTTATKDPTTTSRSSGDLWALPGDLPKLSLGDLLGDLTSDDLSGLLPPGFNPDKTPEEKERTTPAPARTSTAAVEEESGNLEFLQITDTTVQVRHH